VSLCTCTPKYKNEKFSYKPVALRIDVCVCVRVFVHCVWRHSCQSASVRAWMCVDAGRRAYRHTHTRSLAQTTRQRPHASLRVHTHTPPPPLDVSIYLCPYLHTFIDRTTQMFVCIYKHTYMYKTTNRCVSVYTRAHCICVAITTHLQLYQFNLHLRINV